MVFLGCQKELICADCDSVVRRSVCRANGGEMFTSSSKELFKKLLSGSSSRLCLWGDSSSPDSRDKCRRVSPTSGEALLSLRGARERPDAPAMSEDGCASTTCPSPSPVSILSVAAGWVSSAILSTASLYFKAWATDLRLPSGEGKRSEASANVSSPLLSTGLRPGPCRGLGEAERLTVEADEAEIFANL